MIMINRYLLLTSMLLPLSIQASFISEPQQQQGDLLHTRRNSITLNSRELDELRRSVSLTEEMQADSNQALHDHGLQQRELGDQVQRLRDEIQELRRQIQRQGIWSSWWSGVSSQLKTKKEHLSSLISRQEINNNQQNSFGSFWGKVKERMSYWQGYDESDPDNRRSTSLIAMTAARGGVGCIVLAGALMLFLPASSPVFSYILSAGAASGTVGLGIFIEEPTGLLSAIGAFLYTAAESAYSYASSYFQTAHDTTATVAFAGAGVMAGIAAAGLGTATGLALGLLLPILSPLFAWHILMPLLKMLGVPQWIFPLGPGGFFLPILRLFGVPIPNWMLAVSFGIPLRAEIAFLIVLIICYALKGYFEKLSKEKEKDEKRFDRRIGRWFSEKKKAFFSWRKKNKKELEKKKKRRQKNKT